MKKVFFDKSITIPLYARKGDSGNSIILAFFLSTGLEYTEVPERDFQFLLFRRGSDKPFIKLIAGNGIELIGNSSLRVDQEQLSVEPETYFYRLYSNDEKSTWLHGEFVLYGNLEKETFENKKSVIVGDTTVRINIISGNVFVGGVQSIPVTGGEFDFDLQREIYFIGQEDIDADLEITFLNSQNTNRFLYVFSAKAGVTITMPDSCTSKSAMWNGDAAHSFTVTDDDKYIVEGIWDGSKFRLIIT